MAQYNVPDKSAGETWTSDEHNMLKFAVNDNDNQITSTRGDVNANGSNITALQAGQAAQDVATAANTSAISTNAGAIATNAAGVATNVNDIDALETEQTTQDAAIVANTAATVTNANDIAALGTSAPLDVPATAGAEASDTEVVRGDDPRLSASSDWTTQDSNASLPIDDGLGEKMWRLGSGATADSTFTIDNTKYTGGQVLVFSNSSNHALTVTGVTFVDGPTNSGSMDVGRGETLTIIRYSGGFWAVLARNTGTGSSNFSIAGEKHSGSVAGFFANGPHTNPFTFDNVGAGDKVLVVTTPASYDGVVDVHVGTTAGGNDLADIAEITPGNFGERVLLEGLEDGVTYHVTILADADADTEQIDWCVVDPFYDAPESPNVENEYDRISVDGNFDLTTYDSGRVGGITLTSSIGRVTITYGSPLNPQTLILEDGESETFTFNGVTGWMPIVDTSGLSNPLFHTFNEDWTKTSVSFSPYVDKFGVGVKIQDIATFNSLTRSPDFDLTGPNTTSVFEIRKESNSKNILIDLVSASPVARTTFNPTTGAASIAGTLDGRIVSVEDLGVAWRLTVTWNTPDDTYHIEMLPDFGADEDCNVFYRFDFNSSTEVQGTPGGLDTLSTKIHSIVIPSQGELCDLSNQGHGLNPILGDVQFDGDGNAIFDSSVRSLVNTDGSGEPLTIYALFKYDVAADNDTAIAIFGGSGSGGTFIPLGQVNGSSETVRVDGVGNSNEFYIDGQKGFASRVEVLNAINIDDFVLLRVDGIANGTNITIGDHANNANFDTVGTLKALVTVEGKPTEADDFTIGYFMRNGIVPSQASQVSSITRVLAEVTTPSLTNPGPNSTYEHPVSFTFDKPTALRFEHSADVASGNAFFAFGTTVSTENGGVGSRVNTQARLTASITDAKFEVLVQPGTYFLELGAGGSSTVTGSSIKVTELLTGNVELPSEPSVKRGSVLGLVTGPGSPTEVGTTLIGDDTVTTSAFIVTFAEPFASVPDISDISLTLTGNDGGHGSLMNVRVETGSVSESGFTILVSDLSASANVDVYWKVSV